MIAEPGWCPGDELALCLFTDAVLVPWPSLAVIKYAVCCKEIENIVRLLYCNEILISIISMSVWFELEERSK